MSFLLFPSLVLLSSFSWVSLSSRLWFWSFWRDRAALSWAKSAVLLTLSLSWPEDHREKKIKKTTGEIFLINSLRIWLQQILEEIQLHFNTFTVLVVAFVPPATTLRTGSLASGGQVGLCWCLTPGLESLCYGGGVDRIGHAAEAFLWCLVKVLRSGVAVNKCGGGGGWLLLLCFRGVMLDGVVCVGGVKPASRSKGVMWKINV